MELTGQRGELLIKNMPAPPKGKVYEVWIKRGTAAPAPTEALFDVNHAGRAVVDVPASLQSGDAVLVTAEPAGGALTPTPPVLIAAEVS
jgi:hypothetical protein